MKKSKRLQQVSKIAEHKEDEAGRKLAQTRQAVDQKQLQLDQLRQYRAEYSRQFQSFGSEGVSARQLGDFRTFLTKLNGAIEQQEFSVESGKTQLDSSHRQWLETRQRVKALNKAVEKQQSHERHHENKREQAESDEQAMRAGQHIMG